MAFAINNLPAKCRKGVVLFKSAVHSELSHCDHTFADAKKSFGGVNLKDKRIAVFECRQEAHWFVVIVMIKERTILVVDSLLEPEELRPLMKAEYTHQDRFKNASKLFSEIFEDGFGSPFKVIDVDVPKQKDGIRIKNREPKLQQRRHASAQ